MIKSQVLSLVGSINEQKGNLCNEEQTKHICVMRFIYQVLGYDIFDSREVVSEYSCDILREKGERVDYAIFLNGSPIMIMEVKKFGEKLDIHKSQLKRYYSATKSRIGILTNGLRYMFFGDLVDSNLMDDCAFLDIDISSMNDGQYELLNMFSKSEFDIDNILSFANSDREFTQIKQIMRNMLSEPSSELVKLVCRDLVSGRFVDSVVSRYSGIVSKAWDSLQKDIVNERLNLIISGGVVGDSNCSSIDSKDKDDKEVEGNKDREIVTTASENVGFYYIRAMIGDNDIENFGRVVQKDNLCYCNITMDGNQRKSICRLYFNNEDKMKLGLLDSSNKVSMVSLDSVDDILKYKSEIMERWEFVKSL